MPSSGNLHQNIITTYKNKYFYSADLFKMYKM